MKKPILLDHANGGPISRLTKSERKILVKAVLPCAQEEWEMYNQWMPDNFPTAISHYFKMEALVELLEVANCGSTGGFDDGQPDDHSLSLAKRYSWLKERALREFNFAVVVHRPEQES